MAASDTSVLEQFKWEPQPKGQALLNGIIAEFLARCPGAAELARRMKTETGTRFFDWIDHLQVPAGKEIREKLLSVGFTHRPRPGCEESFTHDGALFPQVNLVPGDVMRIDIKVDSVADFASVWNLPHARAVQGAPLSQVRRVMGFAGDRAELWAIERHGSRSFEPGKSDPAKGLKMLEHLEALRRRQRDFGVGPEADAKAFAHARQLVQSAIKDLGVDWACDLFFQCERENWQRKNRAGQVQKARQDRLGLGWANHDHHTYRSSRHCFTDLIGLLELMGFTCRERFYAGHEANWGAQVIEQQVTGITIFADVDMSAEEILGDFSHEPMEPRSELGTVGLWCALHGEAALQAGMHHLECQFDWHALREQLEKDAHIKTMDPFTTFPYLRQAFTEGERWAVKPERIDRLLAERRITAQQAETFRAQGALGSHLENLERNDGYKGFNQQGVSSIISKTDPRKQVQPVGA